jgi:TrkA domain protein
MTPADLPCAGSRYRGPARQHAGVDVTETLLPGVGIRYEMSTRSGLRLAFVVHRDGDVEIAVYERSDPDRARGVFRLDATEADAARLTQRFADLSREVPGLESGRIALVPGSPFDGRPLGDTRARTLTGCSIVALVRDSDVVTAPGPEQPMHAGDILVAIGSRSGLEELRRLLQGPA